MTLLRQTIATAVVVCIGAALGYAIYSNRPVPPKKVTLANEPLVRVETAHPATIEFEVRSRGAVRARTESRIISEVSGRVLETTPALEVGAFFEEGTLLARIDSADYELEVVRARAEVASAEAALARQEADAETALADWKREHGDRPAPALVARTPQLEEARARVAAARGLAARAVRDVARCELRAPYRGRTRSRDIDRGGFVNRGSSIGTIYAIDFAELSLPLAPDDLAFVDLPLGYQAETNAEPRVAVVLSATIAGRTETWNATIVRTEGEIDARTRMIHAIARVDDPYRLHARTDVTNGSSAVEASSPPLAIGQFVEARIRGRTKKNVVRLPRSALRETDEGNRVLVLEDNTIRTRAIDIVRRERDHVLIEAGTAETETGRVDRQAPRRGVLDGERVVISPLEVWSEGMRVRLAEAQGETPR